MRAIKTPDMAMIVTIATVPLKEFAFLAGVLLFTTAISRAQDKQITLCPAGSDDMTEQSAQIIP